MTYVIAEPCVDVLDWACVEECLVEAIYYEDDLPEQWGCTQPRTRGSLPSHCPAAANRSARRAAPPRPAWRLPTPRLPPPCRHVNSRDKAVMRRGRSSHRRVPAPRLWRIPAVIGPDLVLVLRFDTDEPRYPTGPARLISTITSDIN
jgi:hypothetical protein